MSEAWAWKIVTSVVERVWDQENMKTKVGEHTLKFNGLIFSLLFKIKFEKVSSMKVYKNKLKLD